MGPQPLCFRLLELSRFFLQNALLCSTPLQNVFASGSEDHTVMIWNLNPDRIDYKTGRPIAPQPAAEPAAAGAAETGSAAAGKPQQDQQQSGEAAAPPAAEGADKAAAGGEPAAMEVDTTGAGKAGEGEDGQKQAEGAEKAAAGDGEEGKGKEAEGKEGKGGEGGAEEAGASKKRGRDGAAKDGAEKAGAGKGAGGGGGDGAEGDPPELIFKHIGHRFGVSRVLGGIRAARRVDACTGMGCGPKARRAIDSCMPHARQYRFEPAQTASSFLPGPHPADLLLLVLAGRPVPPLVLDFTRTSVVLCCTRVPPCALHHAALSAAYPAQRVTDFQWLPGEPWTVISVSDNSGVADDVADGSLQVGGRRRRVGPTHGGGKQGYRA